MRGALVQLGKLSIDRARWDWSEVANNPFFTPDPEAVGKLLRPLPRRDPQGGLFAVGAVEIEVVAEGAPAGWGAPIYGKLDAEIASALMSINAVKGRGDRRWASPARR